MRGFRRRGIQDRLRRNGGVPTESPTLTLEQLSPSFLSKSGSDYSSGNGGANAGGKKKTKEWADSPASEQEYGNDTHIPWADDENHAQDDGDEFGDDDASHSYYSERFLRSGGNTDTGPSSTSALRDIGNREMYSPPLSQELDEWLAASALRRRKLRTSSMASSLWDDDEDDETASSFSDMSDSSSLRMPASERRRLFSPGEYSERRLQRSQDTYAIKALANEFLCVSMGCLMLVLVAYLAHYLARHGIVDHTHITGF